MKSIHLLLVVLLLPLPMRAAPARENPYDVLSKLLMPFAQVLAEKGKPPHRAVALAVTLEKASALPPEIVGTRVELSLQYPDKVRLSAPVQGERLTIVRRGQELWVHPGSKLSAIVQAAGAEKKLPPADPDYELAPLRLPIPEKQLVFLPVLFRVEDLGTEVLDDVTCRVLEVELMPELARSLAEEGPAWKARVWVSPQHKPVRLALHRPGWEISLRFEDVRFAPTLPKATWKPSPEEATDVAIIEPPRFDQLVRAIVGAR